VRGVNDRSWGGFPLPGALPARVPTPHSPPSLYPSLSALPFAPCGARCGRRWLWQVRLSLGFNIGENTGFYLIARERSPLLRFVGQRGGGEGKRRFDDGARKREGMEETEVVPRVYACRFP